MIGAISISTGRSADVVAHLPAIAGRPVFQATPTGLDRLVENSTPPGRIVQKWEPERIAASAGRTARPAPERRRSLLTY